MLKNHAKKTGYTEKTSFFLGLSKVSKNRENIERKREAGNIRRKMEVSGQNGSAVGVSQNCGNCPVVLQSHNHISRRFRLLTCLLITDRMLQLKKKHLICIAQ